MSIRKVSFAIPHEMNGRRLDDAIAQLAPPHLTVPFSKGKARKLILVGAVMLNRKRIKIASRAVRTGDNIELHVDEQRLGEKAVSHAEFELTDDRVLYEDRHVIAVNKPPGLPTQPTLDPLRDHLWGAVQRYLRKRDQKRDVYVGLHHRLDHDTSGVVVFTKSRQANPGLGRAFAEHLTRKTYLAFVHRPLKPNRPLTLGAGWEIQNHLGKDLSEKKRMKIKSVKSGGDLAHTYFRVEEEFPSGLLIEASPRTGRTHQIRVHLSEDGLPIWGDRTYGRSDEKPAAPRLMLHAWRLSLPHPITGEKLSFQAPPPEDFMHMLELAESN